MFLVILITRTISRSPSLLVIFPARTTSPSCDILPCRSKPSPGTCQEPLLLLFQCILVSLWIREFRRSEQEQNETEDKDAQENELRPEVDHTEEWEVDRHSVQESRYDGGRAHVSRSWIVGRFRTWDNMLQMI